VFVSRSVFMQCLYVWASGEECVCVWVWNIKYKSRDDISQLARGREGEKVAGLLYGLLSPACSGVLHDLTGSQPHLSIPWNKDRTSQNEDTWVPLSLSQVEVSSLCVSSFYWLLYAGNNLTWPLKIMQMHWRTLILATGPAFLCSSDECITLMT